MDISQFLLPSGLLDLTRVRVNPALILKAPRTLLFRRLFLPVCVIDGEALVACGDVNDAAGLQALESALGVPLVAQAADRDAIRRELRLVLGDNQSTQTSDDPVIMVESILRAAALREASDVHLDPFRTEMRVRIRVDGILEDFISIPAEAIPAVISRIKVLAGLDIAERRAPQDGAFVWRHREHAADIRVATLPVRFGERVTMRLLKSGEEGLALETLGLSAPHLDAVRGILARPHGLVLLTGPTGSGKTTTLYAAIRHLLAQSRALNILTVEDPVEYEIPGIAQTEVDSADKVNFSKALRSLLRHDPDVIMIGEIRDKTSLDTAVKAALTGHLVLSTLHTNDAISAPTRLADMGLAPHLIGATLRLSAAQRLVRKLCPHCRVPRAKKISAACGTFPGGAEISRSAAALLKVRGYEMGACPACAGRGYSGRIGIFEIMEVTEEIAAAISAGVPETELRRLLAQKGFRTLVDDAAEKIERGEISATDALSVL